MPPNGSHGRRQLLMLFLKWEQLNSELYISYKVTIILTPNSQSSFILKVVLNKGNNVWDQQNITFIAGISKSIIIYERLPIADITSIELSIVNNEKNIMKLIFIIYQIYMSFLFSILQIVILKMLMFD